MISEKLGAVDIYMGHDAERNRYYGLGLFKATSVDVMVWGEDNWGEAYWGRMVPIEDKYWINGMRAVNCSFRIATTARIELTGYAVKFREAGPL